jgi:hypothetical protein
MPGSFRYFRKARWAAGQLTGVSVNASVNKFLPLFRVSAEAVWRFACQFVGTRRVWHAKPRTLTTKQAPPSGYVYIIASPIPMWGVSLQHLDQAMQSHVDSRQFVYLLYVFAVEEWLSPGITRKQSIPACITPVPRTVGQQCI